MLFNICLTLVNMSLEVLYRVDVDKIGYFIIGISRTKALKIINELNRLSPMETYLYRRGDALYVYLGLKKGGFSSIKECSENMLLYDVRQDSLMICLDKLPIQSKSFIEVGNVKEASFFLKDVSGRYKAVIRKI